MSARKIRTMVVCLVAMLLLTSCDSHKQPEPSHDVTAFNHLIALDFPVKKVTWEIFGTPKYTGGIPGPTDYLTLVAEIEPEGSKTFTSFPPLTTKAWIAPESARPWLDSDFHAFLSQYKNRTVDAMMAPHCRSVEAVLRKSGRPVAGLACQGSRNILIYATVSDNTGHTP